MRSPVVIWQKVGRELALKKQAWTALAVLLAAGGAAACGQAAPASGGQASSALSVAQIAQLKGPNREQELIAGAKKEGKLVWYTALIVNQAVEPMVKAFEKQYPFIKVQYYRGNSGDEIQKVETAYRAHQYNVDVVDGSLAPIVLDQAGDTVPFYSPSLANYPKELVDPQHQWAATNLYFMALGYNTHLVPKSEVPKTYQDLLDPRWKGKMAWSVSEGAGGGASFVGNILLTMGQKQGMAYLQQLSKQQIHNVSASAREVLNQVIAGQYPIALEIFDNHAVISAAQGAPVSWVPLQPVPAFENVISVMKHAPDPYAAMLFIDFMEGKAGQTVLRDAGYLPANPAVPAQDPSLEANTGHFKANFISPAESARDVKQWTNVFNQLFLHP